MAGEIDAKRGDNHYNNFYRTGGWKYSLWKEYRWHRRHFVKRFGLKRGTRVLEVACGNGFHTHLLNRMGFECVGVDRSEAGIAWAKTHFPRSTYHCCDLRNMPFSPGRFDVIYARGCSHYHYDLLSDIALETTNTLMRYLKPGGMFIMAIATDLSGRRDPDKIWHNTLDDYRRHFSSFGKQWWVDWVKGMALCALRQQPPDKPVEVQAQPGNYTWAAVS